MYSPTNNTVKLIIAIVVSELAGVIGGIFTMPEIHTWYAELAKPALNPPAWVFGPVWVTLYFMMGVAAFLVWRKGSEHKDVKVALELFALQLLLNAMWSVVFFGIHSVGYALLDIVLLWLTIAWTMATFCKISRPAAYLLIPYLLWVTFATYLNYSIWVLN